MTAHTEVEVATWIAAVMRAAGVREVRVPLESLANPAVITRYVDQMSDQVVLRLRDGALDVLEGEVAPDAAGELTA